MAMSKSFEQEYREMMNSQTPDLWDRIESGVSNSERANHIIEDNNVLSWSEVCKKVNKDDAFAKKPAVNMYQLYALFGAVACVALVMVGAPAVKQTAITEQEAQQEGEKYINEQAPTTEVKSDASSLKSVKESDTSADINEKKEEATSSIPAKNDKKSDNSKHEKSSAKQNRSSSDIESDNKLEETETPAAISDTEVYNVNEEHIEEENAAEHTSSSVRKSSSNSYAKEVKGASSSTDAELFEKTDISVADATSASSSSADVVNNSNNSNSEPVKEAETSSSQQTAADESEAKQADIENEAEADESKNVQLTGAEEGTSDSREGTVYSDIKAKVTAVSNKDGKVVYTLKIIDDPSGNFKKGKKLKMVSEIELKKKSKYTLSFADYGDTFKKDVALYTVLDAADI